MGSTWIRRQVCADDRSGDARRLSSANDDIDEVLSDLERDLMGLAREATTQEPSRAPETVDVERDSVAVA